MEGNFDRCLPVILREEGGNDDDPHDHGGRTSRGILQREYNAYRQRLGKPLGDVWNASAAEIRDIYLTQYWRPWCDKLPLGLDLAYFDFAVTAGGVQATRTLQRALGNVAVDGRMGIITLRAIENVPHIAPLIREFSERKRAF
jgi:lysozyme family protein